MWLHHFFSPTFFSPKTIDDPASHDLKTQQDIIDRFLISGKKENSCILINHHENGKGA